MPSILLVFFALAALFFLAGLVGLICGYYREEGRVLRGAEARGASLKLMLIGLAILMSATLVTSLMFHD